MRQMPLRLQKYMTQKSASCITTSNKHKTKLDRIYYINLERRKDRKAHFFQQCQKAGIPMELVEKFTAIDGKTFEPTSEQNQMFRDCKYKNSPFCKNIMANQWSHYCILKDMIEKGYESILILQDDVIFKKNFTIELDHVLDAIPQDAEIINIGLHKYAAFADFVPIDLENPRENKTPSKRIINRFVCEIQDHINPCSLAYIVTKKGCHNLLQYFQTHGFRDPTDLNYNQYLQERNINYASSTVLCTGALLGSDVWT